MTDGDIARSRVADLPASVNDTSSRGVPERDTDWPAGDTDSGKPPDAAPADEPMLDLGLGPNEQPLSPDVRRSYNKLNLGPVEDAIGTLALVGNLL